MCGREIFRNFLSPLPSGTEGKQKTFQKIDDSACDDFVADDDAADEEF
jgi:hypothetical protein